MTTVKPPNGKSEHHSWGLLVHGRPPTPSEGRAQHYHRIGPRESQALITYHNGTCLEFGPQDPVDEFDPEQNHPFYNQIALVDTTIQNINAIRVQHSNHPFEGDDPFNGFRTFPYPGEAALHAYPSGDVYQRVPSYYASVGNTISMYATANKSDVLGEAHPGLSTDTRFGVLTSTMIAERRYNNAQLQGPSRRQERAPQHYERGGRSFEGNRRARRDAQFRGGSGRGINPQQAPFKHQQAPFNPQQAPFNPRQAPVNPRQAPANHVTVAPPHFQHPQQSTGPANNQRAHWFDHGVESYNMDDPYWHLIADDVIIRMLNLEDYPQLPPDVVSVGPIHSSDPRFWASPPAWRRALLARPTGETVTVAAAEDIEAQTSSAEAAVQVQAPAAAVASRRSSRRSTTEEGSPIMRPRRVATMSSGPATLSTPAEPKPIRIAPPSGFSIALARHTSAAQTVPAQSSRSASETRPATASSKLTATARPFVMPGSEAAAHTGDTIFGQQPGTLSRPASQDVMRRPRWFQQADYVSRKSSPGAPRSKSAAGLLASRSESAHEDASTQ